MSLILSSKVSTGFPGGASGKEPACQCRRQIRDAGLIPGLGRSPGEEHGSVLAWRIPWTRGAGVLQSTGSQRVRRNWSDLSRTKCQCKMLQFRDWKSSTLLFHNDYSFSFKHVCYVLLCVLSSLIVNSGRLCQGKLTATTHPGQVVPDVVTICVSYFTTGSPGKEFGTNKPPPTGRVRERSKGDSTCPTTSQNPPPWHPSWLSNVCITRKDPESEWLAPGNREMKPITKKPKTASHMAEQLFWVPLSSCSPSKHPFPIKSLVLSAPVSPQTISFWVLGNSPLLGPGRGPLPATIGYVTALPTDEGTKSQRCKSHSQ